MADPIADTLNESLPAFARRRLPPSAAGRAIVRGIERRSPRIIRPRWWAVVSVLRGIVNPLLDRYTERDEKLQAGIALGDDETRITGPKIVAGGDRR
jgi:hypothetical protein